MREFVRQCLHCADTRSGDVVPRPLGETVHGTAPNEVMHLTTMWARVARKVLKVLSEDSGFRYILVNMDDLSNFVSMEPVVV